MALDLMAGYLTYTNASDIVAEAYNRGSVDIEAASTSVFSVTFSWTSTATLTQE